MKLIVIGAGTVGSHFAIAAASMPSVSQVIVADIDLNRAKSVATKFGGEALQLDVTDHRALVAALKRADIAGSAIGPATRFGTTVLRGVIEARVPFIEIGDDPYPTLDMMKLDQKAKAAGVNAVVNLGVSPGVTNLLAVVAAEALDHVEKLTTVWGSEGQEDEDVAPQTEITAALVHWVEQVSKNIPIWKNGRLDELPALTPFTLDYPGVGRVRTHLVGHPEAVTLPARYPDLAECINVMDFSGYIIAALRDVALGVRRGRWDYRTGASRLTKYLTPGNSIFSSQTVSYLWHSTKDSLAGKRWLPEICALAEGTKNGVPTRVGASLSAKIPGGMGPMTGIPAAIAVDMIASGVIQGAGVRPPEIAIDPELFFSRLKSHLRDKNGKPLSDNVSPLRIASAGVAIDQSA